MGYVEQILEPDERLILVGHMHWIVFLRGGVVLAVGLALLVAGLGSGAVVFTSIAALILIAFGLFWLGQAWFQKWTTEIAVTSKRVIQKTGFISRVDRRDEHGQGRVGDRDAEHSRPYPRLRFDPGARYRLGHRGSASHRRPLQLRSAIVVR